MSAPVIGVDVGGTKLAVAMLRDGALSTPRIEASSHDDAAHLVDQLAAAIGEAVAASPSRSLPSASGCRR